MDLSKLVGQQLLKISQSSETGQHIIEFAEPSDLNQQIVEIDAGKLETSTVDIGSGKMLEVIKMEATPGHENLILEQEPSTSGIQQASGVIDPAQNVVLMATQEASQVITNVQEQEMLPIVDEQQPILKFDSYADFKRTLTEYESQTITKFILRNQSKGFQKQVCIHEILENEDKSNDLPLIRWEFCAAKDFLPIPFMGIPYISIGKQVFQCHQGKDYNVNKKQQYELRKEIMNQATRYQIKSRNKGPTKKLNCPVLFAVRKMYLFPEFPVENDSKRNRGSVANKIRAKLLKIKKETCTCHISTDENDLQSNQQHIPGKLQFLTKLPGTSFHNHDVSKAANFMKIQLKKLGSKGVEMMSYKKPSEANPYQYDKHIELITALRSTGDLEQLRNAREAMSNVYPLSEELWLEWFQDELPLAVIPELKEYLLTRFELAVKDYASTKVWHEYCQFAMNNIESPTDIDRARNVFERAITAAGLHITEGASIWDGYREFEIAILDSYQQLQDSGDTVGMDAKVEAQIERIATIFKRQISVPLIGMENVFSIYEDWSPEPISDQTKRAYEKASQKLTLCMEHEEKLHNATEGKLELYKSYIAFEIKSGDPTRIQCIFERAIKDNCLQHDLWISYTNYLDYKLKIPVVCVPVHERAIRNCPWVCQLWVNYLRAMERNNEDYSKVKDVFDRSLKGGFPNAEDYLKVWIAMCDYHRRSITDWTIEDEKVDELRKTFENGITYMNHYFGLEGDKYCTLMREWAFIEAKYLQNVKRSQELWDTVMKKHARDSSMWLEYVQFLMLFTDTLAIRKVFQRCVQITLDSPEPICEEFIRFERRFGSLYEVDDAQQKVDVQLKKLKERREKEALKDLSTQKPSHDNKKKQNKKHEEKKKKKRPSTEKKPPSSNKSTPSSFQGKESLKRSIHQTLSNEDNYQQPNVKKSKNDYEKPIASSTNNPVPQETVVAMETIQTAPQPPHAYQTESILQSSTQTIGEPTSTQPSTDIPRDEQQPAKHLGMGGIMNRLQEMATAPTATDVADKKDEQDVVTSTRYELSRIELENPRDSPI
eukprot:TCONS_00014140-protein